MTGQKTGRVDCDMCDGGRLSLIGFDNLRLVWFHSAFTQSGAV